VVQIYRHNSDRGRELIYECKGQWVPKKAGDLEEPDETERRGHYEYMQCKFWHSGRMQSLPGPFQPKSGSFQHRAGTAQARSRWS